MKIAFFSRNILSIKPYELPYGFFVVLLTKIFKKYLLRRGK